MKQLGIKSLPLIFLVFLFSCNPQKEIYVNNPKTLSFGSEGGFTNQRTEYRLQSDGKLWKLKSLEKDSSLVKQLKKKNTKKVFEETFKLGLDTLKLNSPGNMSYFIQIKSKTIDNKIVWANDGSQSNSVLYEFYKSLVNYTTTK